MQVKEFQGSYYFSAYVINDSDKLIKSKPGFTAVDLL